MEKKNTIINMDLPEGEIVRDCRDPTRFACPICGSSMTLKRSKANDVIEDKEGQPINVIRRTYQCPACGYKMTGHVWRPYGENACCQERLWRIMHPASMQHKVARVEQLKNDTLIYRRVVGFTCVCGTYYEWPEIVIANLPRD